MSGTHGIDPSSESGGEPSMGLSMGKRAQSFGYFEPSATIQFLPACKHCGDKHPLAYKPKLPAFQCPNCGADTEPLAPPIETYATLTGYQPTSLLARGMLAFGKALNRLANRIGD